MNQTKYYYGNKNKKGGKSMRKTIPMGQAMIAYNTLTRLSP